MGTRAVNRNLENKHNRDGIAFGNLRMQRYEEILNQRPSQEILKKTGYVHRF